MFYRVQWLVFYAYFPVYFLDDSGCKCGCLASGYSEPLSEMIGHWSVLIPNDGHCLRSPSPGAWARQQTERANYQLHTRQTKTRTRDNFRRQHPAMPLSWSAKCVIWGYFSYCIVNLTIGAPEDLSPTPLLSFAHWLISLPFSGEFPWRQARVAGSACRTCSLAHTSLWTGGAGAGEKVGIYCQALFPNP